MKFIVSFIIIFVLSLITFKCIEHYKEKKKTEIAILYFDGINEIKNKNYKKAEVIFNKIIEKADYGYSVLSYFKLANINLKKKITNLWKNIMIKLST